MTAKKPLTPWTDGSPVGGERRWPTLEFDGANEREACQECSQWDREHMMPKHGKQCTTCTVRPSGFEAKDGS
jgi:hypothetical protein